MPCPIPTCPPGSELRNCAAVGWSSCACVSSIHSSERFFDLMKFMISPATMNRSAHRRTAECQRRLKPALMMNSSFGRPDRAPAVTVHELAGEDLAWSPFCSLVALHQGAVRTRLLRGRICPGRRIDTARVTCVLHCHCHGIVFVKLRHILSPCFRARPYETGCCSDS
jgi:hypothetical protein